MPFSAWPWALGAGAALVGGVFALVRPRGRHKADAHLVAAVELTGLALALLATAVGVGWRAWLAGTGAATSPADALALLAGGGLVVAAWQTWHDRTRRTYALQRATLSLTLIGGAALLGAAAALAAAWPTSSVAVPAPSPQPMQPATWLFGLRNILASIGLGGWLPALAASGYWYSRTLRKSAPASATKDNGNSTDTAVAVPTGAVPAALARSETVKPAEDPGRIAALFSFPWLTAACLASAVWSMISGAAIDQAVPANLWLGAAWLVGGAYLNITSSWRPLRVSGWLSPCLAAGALVAGVLAAGAAGSLRM